MSRGARPDRRLAAISAQTFLFGYLTNRLADEKEMKVLKEGYEKTPDFLSASKPSRNISNRWNRPDATPKR